MSNAKDLFARLGGTRAMAELLGKAPSTVQSWKAAGRIPAHEQAAVFEKARAAGKPVTAEDLIWPLGRRRQPDPQVAA